MAIDDLLEPISAEAPSGPSMEYDPAFAELERIAQGRPEQQMGEVIIPAEQPNWKEVEAQATKLFGSTKDLRVAVHLTKALAHTRGFAGVADGLGLVKGLVERYWENVHPQLDPDDELDPIMRFNVISELNNSESLVAWIRSAPLVSVRALGQFSLRDLQIATGDLAPPPDTTPVELSTIEGAFSAADVSELQTTMEAARLGSAHVAELDRMLNEHAGAMAGPALGALRSALDQGAHAIEQRLKRRGVATEAQATDGDVETIAADGAAGGAAPMQVVQVMDTVSSREDVVRALDKICEYYARNEPSSPLPLLIERCKRLVHMNFIDIVRDLAPDGLTQVEALRGRLEGEGGE